MFHYHYIDYFPSPWSLVYGSPRSDDILQHKTVNLHEAEEFSAASTEDYLHRAESDPGAPLSGDK